MFEICFFSLNLLSVIRTSSIELIYTSCTTVLITYTLLLPIELLSIGSIRLPSYKVNHRITYQCDSHHIDYEANNHDTY